MSLQNRSIWHLSSLVVVVLGLSLLGQSTNAQAVDQSISKQEASSSTILYFPTIYKSEPPKWLNGPYGGSVVALASDPKNEQVVYAGSLGGGVFKSTDGGATWKNASNGLGWLNHDSLAVDPVDPNILYAGTHGKGIYKSLDGGSSWFEVNQGINHEAVVYTLAVNPGNHNLVYAGTRMKDTLDGTLYKTTDGGAHWEAVLFTPSDWVYSLAVNPYNPRIILAAVHEHGVYRAENYGGAGDWRATNNGVCDGVCQKGRNVAFDPRDWLQRAFYTAWHGDLFRSSNQGSTWSSAKNGLGNSYIYPNGIAINPGNYDNIYLASWKSDVAGVIKSNDSGNRWEGAGLYGRIVYSVAVPKGSRSTVLAGTFQDGLFRSTNSGGSWSQSSTGIVNTQVTGVVLTAPATIYSSTLGSSTQRSTDGGQTWSYFNSGLSDNFINGLVQHPTLPNMLFALTSKAGLRRIDLNAGSSWSPTFETPLSSAAALTDSLLPARQLRAEPIDEMLQLEGETPLAAPQLSPSAVSALNAPALSLAFAPSNPAIAFVGTSGSGVYRSADSGFTWSPAGLSGAGQVISLAIDPGNPNQVFAVTRTYRDGYITSSKIYRTADGGKNWADITRSGLVINAVAVSPLLGNSFVMATNFGVWQYSGSTWTALGLKESNIRTVTASPFSAGLFYVATDTSVYSINMAGETTLIAEDPATNELSVQSINVDPADRYHIYIGTVGRGILRVAIAPWTLD